MAAAAAPKIEEQMKAFAASANVHEVAIKMFEATLRTARALWSKSKVEKPLVVLDTGAARHAGRDNNMATMLALLLVHAPDKFRVTVLFKGLRAIQQFGTVVRSRLVELGAAADIIKSRQDELHLTRERRIHFTPFSCLRGLTGDLVVIATPMYDDDFYEAVMPIVGTGSAVIVVKQDFPGSVGEKDMFDWNTLPDSAKAGVEFVDCKSEGQEAFYKRKMEAFHKTVDLMMPAAK